jgi:hypothetical protein
MKLLENFEIKSFIKVEEKISSTFVLDKMKSFVVLLVVFIAIAHGESAGEVPARCLLPVYQPNTRIRCFDSIPMYSFHPKSRQCYRFIYSGCQGTANVFDSARKCQEACGVKNALSIPGKDFE